MRIAVCIKQVPVLSRIKFDFESRTILREGVPLEVNSFDLLAVDRAAELVKETGGEVVVFTMGPPQAREALMQCLAIGAHRAVHLTDPAMAGADTLATARSLVLALQREQLDLVLCGRNSTDAETGQVGPEIAELLDLPYVGNVRKLDYASGDNGITVERVTDEGYELIRCPLPALVSVTEGIMEERLPSRQDMEAVGNNPAIEEVGALQLSSDSSLFGAAGSPTSVAEIRLVEPQRLGTVIEEADPETAAQMLVEAMRGKPGPVGNPEQVRQSTRYPGQGSKAIWVMAEQVGTELRKATFEILGRARFLAEHNQSEVVGIVIGPARDSDLRTLAAYGADRVLILDGADIGHPTGRAVTSALAQAISQRDPYAVLFASTANGRDLASRIAAKLGLGLTGDCIDLELDEAGDLVQLKPALGGNVVAPILSHTRPYLATLRPGLLSPIEPDWSASAEAESIAAPLTDVPDIEVLEVHAQEDARGLELEAARVVIGVGMGIGGPDNLPAIYRLAESIGASVAASRNVTDAGWLPKQIQVGLTGRAIAPELYIAVGIRGDFNHTVGIQKAGTILAINNNPNPRRSPILQAADISIVGDWETYLPALIEALKPVLSGEAEDSRE